MLAVKTATREKKGFSVLQFAKTGSVVTVQRALHTMFHSNLVIKVIGGIMSLKKLAFFVKRMVPDDHH